MKTLGLIVITVNFLLFLWSYDVLNYFRYLEYLRYLNDLNAEIENSTELWDARLRNWIKYTGGKNLWIMDMVWGPEDTDGNMDLQAFRFKVGPVVQ